MCFLDVPSILWVKGLGFLGLGFRVERVGVKGFGV